MTTPAPTIRRATADDLSACTLVWRAGLADYLGRLNADDGLPVDMAPLHRMLDHFLTTDPERFWVAVRTTDGTPGESLEQVVGFGSANIRGRTWFLSMLFVDPSEQRNGLGRRLLERTLAGADSLVRGTATDSAQPISNALYARMGIVPRMPCLNLVGRPGSPGRLPRLPDGVSAVPIAADDAALDEAVAAVDRELLGHERPADHAWLRREGRICYLYRDAGGRAIGYGYLTPVGRIGPVAATEPAQLWPIVAHLLTAHEPAGASSLWVPGHASEVVVGLLDAGLRLESFPALICWTDPIAPFDRYLPINLALI